METTTMSQRSCITRLTAATTCLTLSLVACGGGGGNGATGAAPVAAPTVSANAVGLWTGTLEANRKFTALVFGDGSYYFLYSQSGTPAVVGGIAQGTGTATAGTFASSAGIEFGFGGSGILSVTVSAADVPRQSLAGSLVDSVGRSAAFTTAYNSAFDQVPTLSALAGTYSGQFTSAAGTFTASMSVSSAGRVSAVNGSCQLSGSVAARSDANAFQLTLSFGGPPCVLADKAFSGVAFIDPSTKQLTGILADGTRASGLAFVGSKS